jgi:hypothetical protein
MDKSPPWEANRNSVKKFSAFYVIRKFITVFTRARHSPYPDPEESNPQFSIQFP